MSRTRSRERGRLVDELRRDLAQKDDRAAEAAEQQALDAADLRNLVDLVPARLIDVADIGCIIALRTAGRPGSREPQHRTIGRLVGVRPAEPQNTATHRDLVVAQGGQQTTIRVALGEPITIRRTA